MPKFISEGLKIVFISACMIFLVWGFQSFLKSQSVYDFFGWCYLMLGTVSPSIVLLGHCERRNQERYLNPKTCLLLEAAVITGLIVFLPGILAPIGFVAQLILSLLGFFLAVPASFIYLYLSPPRKTGK